MEPGDGLTFLEPAEGFKAWLVRKLYHLEPVDLAPGPDVPAMELVTLVLYSGVSTVYGTFAYLDGSLTPPWVGSGLVVGLLQVLCMVGFFSAHRRRVRFALPTRSGYVLLSDLLLPVRQVDARIPVHMVLGRAPSQSTMGYRQYKTEPTVKLVLGPLPVREDAGGFSRLLYSRACYATHIDDLRAVVRALWPASIRPPEGDAPQGDDAAVWRCDRLLDEADIRPPSFLDSQRNVGLLIAGVLLVILLGVALLPL